MEHTGPGKPAEEVEGQKTPPEDGEQRPAESGGLPWRRRLVLLLLLVVAVSVTWRIRLAAKPADRQAGEESSLAGHADDLATGLVPGQINAEQEAAATPEKKSGIGRLLPFVTEGGVAMLLGIALGVATRSFIKLALIGVAVVFIAIQVLVFREVIAVDWQAAERTFTALKDYVWNVSTEHNLSTIVQHKVPSAGALSIGYFLGLRR